MVSANDRASQEIRPAFRLVWIGQRTPGSQPHALRCEPVAHPGSRCRPPRAHSALDHSTPIFCTCHAPHRRPARLGSAPIVFAVSLHLHLHHQPDETFLRTCCDHLHKQPLSHLQHDSRCDLLREPRPTWRNPPNPSCPQLRPS